MKRTLFFIFLICLLIVSSAAADDLDTVKKSGVLRLAVSSDKAPFVFYDVNQDVTGIDVKLMEEVANRMGVKLDVLEMSVNDLVGALEIEQADVIGGAFSKTDSRMAEIDFSRIYYIADPVFITGNTIQLQEPLQPESLKDRKIGVLKNSGFEEWVKAELVEKGYVLKRDLFTYDKNDDAIRALERNKIDLILMDYSLYESRYMGNTNFKIYNYGSAKDSYAFGVQKNSSLKAEINKHLGEMLKDGTAQKIADDFFTGNYEEDTVIQWTAKKAAATATPPAPAATSTPDPALASCTYAMAYVTDLTIPDGQPMSAGSTFTKGWRIKNTGTCPWTTDCTFAFVSGSQMDGKTYNFPTTVYPGNTIDINIDMTAPASAGTYQGNWQLRTPQGKAVGYQLWVQIVVPGTYTGPEWASVSSDSSGPSYSPVVAAAPTNTPGFHFDGSSLELGIVATAIAVNYPTATPKYFEVGSSFEHGIVATAIVVNQPTKAVIQYQEIISSVDKFELYATPFTNQYQELEIFKKQK